MTASFGELPAETPDSDILPSSVGAELAQPFASRDSIGQNAEPGCAALFKGF